MRPFRRRAPSADAPVATPAAAPVAPVAADAPVISRSAESRPGWADVPALGRSFGTPDLTVGVDSFRSGLATLAPPHPFLAPLGHLVSADAPSGTVTGLAVPLPVVSRSVEHRTDVPELPVAPAPSAANGSGSGPRSVQRWSAPSRPGPAMVTASSVDVPPLAFDPVAPVWSEPDTPAPPVVEPFEAGGVLAPAVEPPPDLTVAGRSTSTPLPEPADGGGPAAGLPPDLPVAGRSISTPTREPVGGAAHGDTGASDPPPIVPIVERPSPTPPPAIVSRLAGSEAAHHAPPAPAAAPPPPAPVSAPGARHPSPPIPPPSPTATRSATRPAEPSALLVVSRRTDEPGSALPVVSHRSDEPSRSSRQDATLPPPPVSGPSDTPVPAGGPPPPVSGPSDTPVPAGDPPPPTADSTDTPVPAGGPPPPASAPSDTPVPASDPPPPPTADPADMPLASAPAGDPPSPAASLVGSAPLRPTSAQLLPEAPSSPATRPDETPSGAAATESAPGTSAARPVVARSAEESRVFERLPETAPTGLGQPHGEPPAPITSLVASDPLRPVSVPGSLDAPRTAPATPVARSFDQRPRPEMHGPLDTDSVAGARPLARAVDEPPGRSGAEAGMGAVSEPALPVVARATDERFRPVGEGLPVAGSPGDPSSAPAPDALAAGPPVWNEVLPLVGDGLPQMVATQSGPVLPDEPALHPADLDPPGTGTDLPVVPPRAGDHPQSTGGSVLPTVSRSVDPAPVGSELRFAPPPADPAAPTASLLADREPLVPPSPGPRAERRSSPSAEPPGVTGAFPSDRSPLPTAARQSAAEPFVPASSPAAAEPFPPASLAPGPQAPPPVTIARAVADPGAGPPPAPMVPPIVRPARGAEPDAREAATHSLPVVARAAAGVTPEVPATEIDLPAPHVAIPDPVAPGVEAAVAPLLGSEPLLPEMPADSPLTGDPGAADAPLSLAGSSASAPLVARAFDPAAAMAPATTGLAGSSPLPLVTDGNRPPGSSADTTTSAPAATVVRSIAGDPSPDVTVGLLGTTAPVPTSPPSLELAPAPVLGPTDPTAKRHGSRSSSDPDPHQFSAEPTPVVARTTAGAPPAQSTPAAPLVGRRQAVGPVLFGPLATPATDVPATDVAAPGQRGHPDTPLPTVALLGAHPILEPAEAPAVQSTTATGAELPQYAAPVTARGPAATPRLDPADHAAAVVARSVTATTGAEPAQLAAPVARSSGSVATAGLVGRRTGAAPDPVALPPSMPVPPRPGLGPPLPAGTWPPAPAAAPQVDRPPAAVLPVVQQTQAKAPPRAGSADHAQEVVAAALAAGGTPLADGSIAFAPSPSAPDVQRAPEPPATASADVTPPATRTATWSDPPPEQTEGNNTADQDLDRLASQLYDRMLFRLRRDLRHELERKGQHANLRRS